MTTTHRYLMNKNKHELANRMMEQLNHLELLARTITADQDHNASLIGSPIPCECSACRIARSYIS